MSTTAPERRYDPTFASRVGHLNFSITSGARSRRLSGDANVLSRSSAVQGRVGRAQAVIVSITYVATETTATGAPVDSQFDTCLRR